MRCSLVLAAILAATPAFAQNSARMAQLELCREEARLLHPKKKTGSTQAEQQRRAFMESCMARKGFKLR